MPTCAAYGCDATSSGKKKHLYKDRSFHIFPDENFSEWEEKVKREGYGAYKHSVLCSIHFEDHDFVEDLYHKYVGLSNKKTIKRLKKGVVPTLYLDNKKPPKKRTTTIDRIKRKEKQEVQ